jgi:hypothetical protein
VGTWPQPAAGLRPEASDGPFVFVDGGQISAGMVARIVTEAAEAAGIDIAANLNMVCHSAGHMLTGFWPGTVMSMLRRSDCANLRHRSAMLPMSFVLGLQRFRPNIECPDDISGLCYLGHNGRAYTCSLSHKSALSRY